MTRIERIRANLAAIPGHGVVAIEERDEVVIVEVDGVRTVKHPERLDLSTGYAGDIAGVRYAMDISGMVGWSIDAEGVVHPHPEYRRP